MKNLFLSLIVSLGFTAAVGALTAARVEAQPAVHQAIQNAVSGVQSTANSIETKVDDIQTQLDNIPPAWSEILPAANRFKLVMGSAAVLDRETGLVWEQSAGTTAQNWVNAQNHCNRKTVGNRSGWRLPTIQELASLVDHTQFFPSLPPGHPFSIVQIPTAIYWSATTTAGITSFAEVVLFTVGGVGNRDKNIFTVLVWCVRGGQGVDPQ